MTSRELHFVVPGRLDQLTGGFVYDAHMVAGMRELGWQVQQHELPGRFPEGDAEAAEALTTLLASMPDGARVVIDGLAMGGLPEPIEGHGSRLQIVCMLHHPLAEETGITKAEARRFAASERRALKPCAGVVVSSVFTSRVLAEYDVPADRIRVVVPGTEPAEPAAGPEPGQPPLLLCVASVTPRKGHDVLVGALERVRDLPWTCVCVGSTERDPAHAEAVMRRVDNAGLGDRIAFVGERQGERLDELYHGASVFALASHYEGYGMALTEALARALPVVSTTGGAIPFTVPSEAGILVEPGDEEAFADALRVLLAPDGVAHGTLSVAARRHAAELPTWRDAARAFAGAVEDLTE